MSGKVYFIQEGLEGAIKIGFTSTKPISRLKCMQSGNSNELRLLGFVPGPPDAELGWHERFKHSRKRLEWFFPTPELVKAIEAALAAPLAAKEPHPPINRDAIREWVKRNGLTLKEFAMKMGYHPSHLSMKLRSTWPIDSRLAYRVQSATNGELKAEGLLHEARAHHARKQAETIERQAKWRRDLNDYTASQDYADLMAEIAEAA